MCDDRNTPSMWKSDNASNNSNTFSECLIDEINSEKILCKWSKIERTQKLCMTLDQAGISIERMMLHDQKSKVSYLPKTKEG